MYYLDPFSPTVTLVVIVAVMVGLATNHALVRLGSWSIDVYLIPTVMLAPTISDRSTSRLYRSVEILSVDLLESSSELALNKFFPISRTWI